MHPMYEFTYVATLAYTLMAFGKLWPKVVEKDQKDAEMDFKCRMISESFKWTFCDLEKGTEESVFYGKCFL